MTVEAATFLLEGRSRKWWKSASAPVLQEHGHVWWSDFCRLFCQLYFPPAFHQAKAIELLNLKQGSLFVDENQQKFIDLLPYCPHIGVSSEVKNDHFLQWINQENFYGVMVCDDPTSYESLVNRCRQAEISVNRAKSFQSSQPTSSLGPHAQSFKKSSSSTSSSGSGGVMRFGKKGKSLTGYLKKNCTQAGGAGGLGSGSQTTVQQRPLGQPAGGSNMRPRAASQCHQLPYVALDIVLSISTPIGLSALAKRLVLGCPLESEWIVTRDLYSFTRLVVIAKRPPMPLVSALRASRALESGREGYLIYVIDLSVGSVGIGSLPVNEFSDVFLDEIPGFPPVREVEFDIDLMPDTSPISRAS
ncbi:uncharacterized protein [Henckelia pumila]|uniref:uncharacterized protein n=1 Tax=Henckelia pumila TaxID=405737 RepID=UPI003C6DE45E